MLQREVYEPEAIAAEITQSLKTSLIFLLNALGGLKCMNEVQIFKWRECTQRQHKGYRMEMRGFIKEMNLVVPTHVSALQRN